MPGIHRASLEQPIFFLDHRPNQGWMRSHGHHVLLACRMGALDTADFSSAQKVLTHVVGLNSHMLREKLMFRGVWHDNKYGTLKVVVELLHPQGTRPTWSRDEIAAAITHGLEEDDFDLSVVVDVYLTPALFDGEEFDPLNAAYYDKVERELFWR